MIQHSVGTRDSVRVHNQQAIFEMIHRAGPISRAEIATRLGLSPATVTNITGDLIGRDLIFEARAAAPGGVGRRAILLEVAYDRARVAGIKLSNVGITCALTNLNAEVVATASRPYAGANPAATVEAVAAALADFGAERPAALGLSLPGVVDTDSHTVRYSPLLGWARTPIGTMLEARLGVPVLVENDVNALALAEAWFGYGREHTRVMVVTQGRGIGLGIVLNGEVYRGPRGGAGEFGHILLEPGGPKSRHAARGTLEALLADDALLRDAAARGLSLPPTPVPEDLVVLAEGGDRGALELYRDAGKTLGRALSILVNLFAPSLIIVGGEGMRAAPYFLPSAREALQRTSFGDLAEHLELVVDTWGDDAWARGAAGLVARRYLLEAVAQAGGDRS